MQRTIGWTQFGQERTAFGGVVSLTRREREGDCGSSICGNHMNLGVPSSSGLADRLWSVFFRAPVPSGWTLMLVLSSDTASSLMRTIWERCNCSKTRSRTPRLGPAIHAGVDVVPVAKPLRKTSPLAAMFGHIKNGIEDLQIGEADVATLHRQTVFDNRELGGCDFHDRSISLINLHVH